MTCCLFFDRIVRREIKSPEGELNSGSNAPTECWLILTTAVARQLLGWRSSRLVRWESNPPLSGYSPDALSTSASFANAVTTRLRYATGQLILGRTDRAVGAMANESLLISWNAVIRTLSQDRVNLTRSQADHFNLEKLFCMIGKISCRIHEPGILSGLPVSTYVSNGPYHLSGDRRSDWLDTDTRTTCRHNTFTRKMIREGIISSLKQWIESGLLCKAEVTCVVYQVLRERNSQCRDADKSYETLKKVLEWRRKEWVVLGY